MLRSRSSAARVAMVLYVRVDDTSSRAGGFLLAALWCDIVAWQALGRRAENALFRRRVRRQNRRRCGWH